MPWHLAYIRKVSWGIFWAYRRNKTIKTGLAAIFLWLFIPVCILNLHSSNPQNNRSPQSLLNRTTRSARRAPRNYPGLHEISTFNSQAAATSAAWPKVLRSPGAAGQATARKSGIRCASEKHKELATIGALIIRIRFSCKLYNTCTKEPPKTLFLN